MSLREQADTKLAEMDAEILRLSVQADALADESDDLYRRVSQVQRDRREFARRVEGYIAEQEAAANTAPAQPENQGVKRNA